MANLQIKGIDDQLYHQLKQLAAGQNRSVSQQVVLLIRDHLAHKDSHRRQPTPAQVLLELAGSWEDQRPASQLVAELKRARRSSSKLSGGL